MVYAMFPLVALKILCTRIIAAFEFREYISPILVLVAQTFLIIGEFELDCSSDW